MFLNSLLNTNILLKRSFIETQLQKAALKEGGKKGQDIAGMFETGGIKFYHLVMEKCGGDIELLKVCLNCNAIFLIPYLFTHMPTMTVSKVCDFYYCPLNMIVTGRLP